MTTSAKWAALSPRSKSTRRAAALWLALALSVPAVPAVAQTATLSPNEARMAAAKLLSEGHAHASIELTRVLVQRDPQDATSLILLAQGLRTTGDFKAAQDAARQAWKAAHRDVEKYGAALAMAQALSSDNHKTRAQLWLRRAAQVAPSDATRARAIRDYQFVRMANPWSVNLSFGLVPSDNVNNAPRDNTIVLGGLVFVDPTAVPLSGIEISSQARLRYNFNITETHRNYAALSWTETRVVLTDDAVPAGVEDGDFLYQQLRAQVGRDFTAGPGKPRHSYSLSYGRIWYGGSHLSDEVRADWNSTFTLPEEQYLTWSADIGYAERQDNDVRSGTTGSLGLSWSRPTADDGRLTLNAEAGRTVTDSKTLTHSRAKLGLTYVLGQKMLGARTSVALSGQFRSYDDAVYGPDPRQDVSASLSTSFLFTNLDSYGFAPKVTLDISRNHSNIGRFDTQSMGLNIGFQSVF